MSSAPQERSYVEAFYDLLNPNRGAVITEKEKIVLDDFIAHIESELRKAHSVISPFAFFKRVMDRLDENPVSFKYFLKHSEGIGVVSDCIKSLSSEQAIADDVEKTKSYLAELKTPRSTTDPQNISEMIADAFTPEAIEAAKQARKARQHHA